MQTTSSSPAMENQREQENAFDQIAPSSASTSAKKVSCEIFINYRGCDVKHTLANAIYHTLKRMGIRTFLDVELQPGDVITTELQQAMASASLHIAIFSQNYAQSPWCLAELSFMLKTGTTIIPIFYHVQPSDLTRIVIGKGIYAEAFTKLEMQGRFTPQKLDEWRKALSTISYYSGFMINDIEDERKLLESIGNYVLKVMRKVPLYVAKHPVGLERLVQEFERATVESAQSHDIVKIVGIVGIEGSGKTTLAKELFNRKSSSFDGGSFIFDVGDAASKNVLPDQQKKLLRNLNGADHSSFDSVDEGKAVLANSLRSLRVLIILDDVDHIDQLDALLPDTNNLGSNSLVIVTTRELRILASWGVSCIYRMTELSYSESQQLFCWYAFLRPFPPSGFEDLVEKFLAVCGGLPLYLKIFGGELYGRDSEYWLSQLDKISRILRGKIKPTLQGSYDVLDEIKPTLQGSYDVLEEIKPTPQGSYDVLDKDMPFQSTNQPTIKEQTIIGSAQHYQMTNQAATRQVYVCGCIEIHQIANPTRELIVCKSIQKFRKSIGQLQHLETIVVDGCVNTNLKALPEEFSHLKVLRRLTLRWCRALTSLPRHFGNLKSLQHLDLAFCNQLKELPLSFKQFHLLQHINFEGCSNLVIPPHILGKITTLKHLNFKDCGKLRVLPTQVPYQPSLKTLNLVGTSLEELPNEVGMLINLEVLEIGSPYLTELTVSMGNMINLQTLNVKGCPSLKCLPESLGLLGKLSINAPQALKETLKEMVEETPNWRCVIL